MMTSHGNQGSLSLCVSARNVKGSTMPKRNLAWILVVVMIALLMWRLPQTIAGRDSVYRAFGPLVDARAQIHKRCVDEVDDDTLVGGAVEAGIAAMIKSLHDPYAVYLNESEYA